MRRERELVKEPPDAPAGGGPPRNFSRHFVGYELGLGTVSMVLTLALLALPRASIPCTLPLPVIDRARSRADVHAEHELAAHATQTGLPFEVRAVGESIRRLGRTEAHGEDQSHERDDMRARVKAVAEANETPKLVELRAVQTEFFLNALHDFERTGTSNADLTDLGGNFVAQAEKNGWLDERHRFVADETARRVLFHLRWADLLGKLDVFPFSPSLNDWRIYYRFLLEHPQREAGAGAPEREARTRLRVVVALGHKDPEYPLDLARGYLAYRSGDREAAASAYRHYLGNHDGGGYALRARNHLIWALQGVSSE